MTQLFDRYGAARADVVSCECCSDFLSRLLLLSVSVHHFQEICKRHGAVLVLQVGLQFIHGWARPQRPHDHRQLIQTLNPALSCVQREAVAELCVKNTTFK